MSLITTNDRSFEFQPDETLLEALERTGHEVEYQCKLHESFIVILDNNLSIRDGHLQRRHLVLHLHHDKIRSFPNLDRSTVIEFHLGR